MPKIEFEISEKALRELENVAAEQGTTVQKACGTAVEHYVNMYFNFVKPAIKTLWRQMLQTKKQ